MRILIDVGANKGQFLGRVYENNLHTCFDRIIAFEPFEPLADRVRDRYPQVEILSFGLWNKNTKSPIYDAGTKGASVYSDKYEDVNPDLNNSSRPIVKCRFIRATDWFMNNISNDDIVVMKMNCEGSECDIINDLLDSGEFSKISNLFVHFDVKKIPSQKHMKKQTIDRLRQLNYLHKIIMARYDEDFPYVQVMQRELGTMPGLAPKVSFTCYWYNHFLKDLLS